jgi:ABC-type phosphate transport system auxiliary subunit
MRLRRRSRPSRHGSGGDTRGADPRVAELQHRLEHLEAAFEGLQDAVHRDAVRQNQELDELRKRMQPEAIARSLSDSARERGI